MKNIPTAQTLAAAMVIGHDHHARDFAKAMTVEQREQAHRDLLAAIQVLDYIDQQERCKLPSDLVRYVSPFARFIPKKKMPRKMAERWLKADSGRWARRGASALSKRQAGVGPPRIEELTR